MVPTKLFVVTEHNQDEDGSPVLVKPVEVNMASTQP
jgi:hypothetical protein